VAARTLRRTTLTGVLALATGVGLVVVAPAASATPVCTDGLNGGPPQAVCGGRIFPEAANSQAYVQYRENAAGFSEYRDGLLALEATYPRYVDVFTLKDKYGANAVSAGEDDVRAGDEGDTGDGREIYVIRLTDKQAPAAGKQRLFFSLSVHGNERGGLEGGLRAIEDLARDATAGDAEIVDGVANYNSNTGKTPEFNSYPVRDVLAKEDVYFVSFNPDGWTAGDIAPNGELTGPFVRTNGRGVDLNRQMPTKGSINITRNPLFEREMEFGTKLIDEVAKGSPGGLMAYGADIHGELTSRAYVDIMYPAGQFDSVKHRQLMAIAERTKSVIDATLYAGIQNQIEEATGGNEGEGLEETVPGLPANTIPTMPAHWATVWDTLGYTDTGFIGDYLAADVSVTGMDYEIFLNHTVPDKTWNVYLQENHINASRAIIKTAMAYALTQSQDFNAKNVRIETGGQAGYVHDPVFVRHDDANGPGELPGPDGDGIGANGLPVKQAPYKVSRMKWFEDTSRLMPKPFKKMATADIAASPKTLDQLDTLVIADNKLPKDSQGRPVDATKYWANIKKWVEKGGNLVLTDRALHGLGDLGVIAADAIEDITVYQPFADFEALDDPMIAGLRANARQLVEAPLLGYGIGDTASPMTAIDPTAFADAGGTTVGTTEDLVTVGHLSVGSGRIQVVGGALPTQTEDLDHRYGLRDYALTYSGLFIMENVLKHDAPGLGVAAPAGFNPAAPTAPTTGGPTTLPTTGTGTELALIGLGLFALAVVARRRRAARIGAPA
jgi:hypothetical protein